MDAAMPTLADRPCVPCRGGLPPLDVAAIAPLLAQLDGWVAPGEHHLEKTYRVKNFARALALVNRIGAIAEEQNHHPDVTLAWGRVGVTIWTHKINGLTESDFIFAAKCDRAFAEAEG
jgi:4a-hydroxytetrahydrobiopterin dehydratase